MNKKLVCVFGSCCFLLIGAVASFSNIVSQANDEVKKIRVISVDEIKSNQNILLLENNKCKTKENIETKEALVINNNAMTLYPEYVDEDKELNVALEKCSGLLGELSKYYSLNELSKDNWREYQKCMYTYLDEERVNTYYNDTSEEYIALLEFFDIYENKESNDTIKTEIENITSEEEIVNNSVLMNTLPSNIVNYIKEEYGVVQKCITRMPFNVDKAVSYARNHATSPNKQEYKTCEADCTNFVSQIVNVGGKAMTNEWKAYQKSMIIRAFTKYTFAWCNANGFVNYYKTTSEHNNFADVTKAAKVGDVIAYDTTNDNDWDHVGYVVGKGSYSNSLGYTDLEIAQHSRNYCAWISDDANGWDTLKDNYDNVVYSLVSFR